MIAVGGSDAGGRRRFTRGVRFFLVLGVGLFALDGAILALIMSRALEAKPPAWSAVSSGNAAIGGPFTLVATDGTTVTDRTYRGKWMLIYFGYTFCPDACPTALTNISIALQTLRGQANMIQPLFITIDPKRDSRDIMTEYLKSFDPRIVGLTGSEEQTRAATKAYRVSVEPQPAEAGNGYLVDHSSYIYVMDPKGNLEDVIEGATPGPDMAEKLWQLTRNHTT